MPIICSRCGIDQPDDAFTQESQPLCETCYEIELEEEEEEAGGEVGNDFAVHGTANKKKHGDGEDVDDDDDDDENMELLHDNEATTQTKKPYKPVSLSNAARLVDQAGNLLLRENHPDNQEPQSPDPALLEPLVDAVEGRGYSLGLGLDSRDVLKFRLARVFFDETHDSSVIHWLTKPLISALIHGGDALTVRVAPMNIKDDDVLEEQTLLHWVCQWKLLQVQCGWKGHDDMVDLLIRAGAPVDAALKNGCTPLFFAVKYGTVDTVRLLIQQGGANPNHKDRLGQTCLRNALPQASPYILKFLLQYIPANETFKTETFDGGKIRINALDILVTEFVTPDPDVSWVTLGMPSVDDYARCIVLLLQRGLRLSPHYPDVSYFLGHYLQGSIQAKKRLFYTRRIADLLFGQWLPPSIRDELETTHLQDDEKQDEEDESTADDYVMVKTDAAAAATAATMASKMKERGCPICANKHKTDSPLITLYCGHSFCQDHIRNHVTSVHAATDTRKAVSCPICFRPLGRDVLCDDAPMEIDAELMSLQQQRRLGLTRLSLEQLQFECKARNLEVPKQELKEHCLESLVVDWQDFTVPQSYMEAGNDDEVQMSSRLIFEMSLSRTMISQDHYLWVAPTQGSIMIPIIVKGIPIMALISTTSPYTVVSPRFIEMFGFKINPNMQYTASNPLKFTRPREEEDVIPERPVDNNVEEEPEERPKPQVITAPQVHLTAVEDFVFQLGSTSPESNIEIHLKSVFQCSEPNTQSFPVGVVLGLDFFQSAAWTQMSVEVDLEACLGRTLAFFTGGLNSGSSLSVDLIEPQRADFIEEELRYYSHAGKIFRTPIWHVYASKQDYSLSLEQYLANPQPPPGRGEPLPEKKAQVEMTECAWCCRNFPLVTEGDSRTLWEVLLSKPKDVGMIHCSLCNGREPTYYCDTKCQQKALEVHSSRRHGGMDLSGIAQQNSNNSRKRYLIAFSLVAVLFSIIFLPGKPKLDGIVDHSVFEQRSKDGPSIANEVKEEL